MDEYINREETKRELSEWCISLNRPNLLSRDDTMFLLDNIPAADVAPVVHGRWEWIGPYRYNDDGMIGTCSVCKERLRLFAYNYCPNCGAKMDGAENG